MGDLRLDIQDTYWALEALKQAPLFMHYMLFLTDDGAAVCLILAPETTTRMGGIEFLDSY
jgi:hypothetical protein